MHIQPALSALSNLTSLHAQPARNTEDAGAVVHMPALEQLVFFEINHRLKQEDFVPLLQLTRLTSLSMHSERKSFAPSLVITTLVSMAWLVELGTTAFHMSDDQVQQLTALSQLTKLSVSTGRLSPPVLQAVRDADVYKWNYFELQSKVRSFGFAGCCGYYRMVCRTFTFKDSMRLVTTLGHLAFGIT